MAKIRILSFFSGCGGLDLGFHNAGFDILYSSDIEAIFCDTMKLNQGLHFSKKTKVESRDIRDILPSELPDDIDFIIGGPPCQTFSASGRRAGGAAGQLDERGTLFQAYGEIISSKQPKGFLFENVRGILSSNKGKDWDDIKKYFSKLGYKLDYRILDACDYGIPQHRERLILVGHHLEQPFEFPRPTFGPDSKRLISHLSVGEAFDGVVHFEDLESLALTGGKYSHLLEEVPPGGNYLYFTEKRGYPNPIFAYRSRFSDFLYKADPSLPTKTIIASPGKYTGPLHWENRYFSVAEYRRIQGFPDDFVLKGKRAEQIQQIGNSVSPKMAEVLAYAVRQQLFKLPKKHQIELIEDEVKLSFDKRKGKKAKLTREKHLAVAQAQSSRAAIFRHSDYEANVMPNRFKAGFCNVKVSLSDEKRLKMVVRSDQSRKLFAKMKLAIGLKVKGDAVSAHAPEFTIDVDLYGGSEFSIQTMWNAIDDWVIRSSGYHSLFEIYGHFTEPHPNFRIESFKPYSNHPICRFAAFASDFKNCSRFVGRDHLMDLFSGVFQINEFLRLVEYLRSFRFDVRCQEINVAISPDCYMVTYPFTLPNRKQMNFKLENEDKKNK